VVQGDGEQSDSAREGFDHLQTAAHEMIAAARSMLDACEELLEDPKAGDAIASVIGSVARAVGGVIGVPNSSGGSEEAEPEAPRVKPIKIS
jgi:hypothetical protein